MNSHRLFVLLFSIFFFLLRSFPLSASEPGFEHLSATTAPRDSSSSPFFTDLETLQKLIGYEFESIDLLSRAMTHPSYSNENNRALAILGLDVIQTKVSLQSLEQNIDTSPKDLNSRILEVSDVDSCAAGASSLRLQSVVRVSQKTNSSAPTVVCSAFRALFGAVAVDSTKADDAGDVFLKVWKHIGANRAVFDLIKGGGLSMGSEIRVSKELEIDLESF